MLSSIFRATFSQGDGLFQRAQPSPTVATLGCISFSRLPAITFLVFKNAITSTFYGMGKLYC